MRRLAVLCLMACVLIACGGAAGPPPSAPSALLDQPIPKFKRSAVAGQPVSTHELPGQLIVVKFFAKYCEPCKKTLPAAQKLYQESSDTLFVGIAEDEAVADVEDMIRSYGLTFPVIHDADNQLADRFRLRELPYAFVADRGGIVRWAGGPKQRESDLERALEWVRRGRER